MPVQYIELNAPKLDSKVSEGIEVNKDHDHSLTRTLHRTVPGTVFSPSFKHNKQIEKTQTDSANSNTCTNRKGAQSFVEYLSKRFPYSLASLTEANIRSNFNYSSMFSKQCLPNHESDRSNINEHSTENKIIHSSSRILSHLQESSNSITKSSSVHLFSQRETVYAQQVDLYLRTRSSFDTRLPLSYSIKLTTLVREFLFLDATSMFSGNAISGGELIVLIQRHPRFKLSCRKKMVSLAYLTPFHENPHQILYGYYLCSCCKRRWESGASWQDIWQRCRQCHSNIYPYDQHLPISREKLFIKLLKLTRASHLRCSKGNSKKPILGLDDTIENTSANEIDREEGIQGSDRVDEEFNHEEEEDEEITIDLISLRDRIEKHCMELCQKCLQIGQLCIPYRHYSI
jgi:hypothetical protein